MINSSRSLGFALPLALVLAALTPHCGSSDDATDESAGAAGTGASAGFSPGGAGSGGQLAGGAGQGGKAGSGVAGGGAAGTPAGGQGGAGASAGGAGTSGTGGNAGNAGQVGGAGDGGQAGSGQAGGGQAGQGDAGSGQAGGGQAGGGQAGGSDAGTGGVSAGGQAGAGGDAGTGGGAAGGQAGGGADAGTGGVSAGGQAGAGGDAGMGGGGGGGPAPCEVIPTFAEVLAKPLSGCSGFEPPCHNAGAGSLHFKASDPDGTYAALVNVTSSIPGAGLRVAPGDAANSFLYRKLTNILTPDEGDPMPKPGGLAGATWKELPADQIELLRCWIQGGAKKN